MLPYCSRAEATALVESRLPDGSTPESFEMSTAPPKEIDCPEGVLGGSVRVYCDCISKGKTINLPVLPLHRNITRSWV